MEPGDPQNTGDEGEAPRRRFDTEPFGKYFLVDRIAVGGMAEVFRARTYGESGFEKDLVIKRILPHLTENADFVQMFVEEAKLTVQLQHPNIIQVYDFGKIRNHYYLAMEGIYGSDLKTLQAKLEGTEQPLPLKFAAYVIHEVATGLYHAHGKADETGTPLGIVHRDVSPSNVLISYDGQVKLVDFGIAKASKSAFTDTEEGVLKGKFEYMSPEQARGEASAVDPRSDVFCAGICLWEMVTGRKLFKADTDIGTLNRIRNGDVPPVHEANKEIPPELGRIIHKALALAPEDRYADAEALRRDLEEFLKPATIHELTQDAAAWMQESFASERQEERERIERGREAASALVRMEDTVELELEDDDLDEVDTIEELPLVKLDEPLPDPPPAAKKSKAWVAIAVVMMVLLVLVVGGGVAAWQMGWIPGTAAPVTETATHGTLALDIQPPEASGAAITLDGEPIQVPYDRLEPDRQYRIRVEKEGFEPYEEGFQVGAGETLRLRAKLTATVAEAETPTPEPETPTPPPDSATPAEPDRDKPPAIVFRSTPNGASVRIGGATVGTTPFRLDQGTPGKVVRATLVLDGYEDTAVSKTFPENGSVYARATLAKLPEKAEPAFLRINATPWADVYVDGKKVGHSPIGSLEVEPGTHTVRLVCPPLGTEETKKVTVGPGETKPVSADLEE